MSSVFSSFQFSITTNFLLSKISIFRNLRAFFCFLSTKFQKLKKMDGELWRIWQILFVCSILGLVTSHVSENNDKTDSHFDRLSSPVFDDSQDVPGEPMTPIDYQNAQGLVADSPPKTDQNGKHNDPIEIAGQFEGDILLPNKRHSDDGDDERNAIIGSNQKWPGGHVPYVLSSEFNAQQRGVIAKAMLEYKKRTCISFKPRTTESDYIHIHRGNGCSSFVGRTGGAQPVSIGSGCEYTGIVVHELMHAVGFWHEQSRYDRDDYVTVYYDNIISGMEFNFRKFTWREVQNLSVPYDLTSVMHYGPYSFTKYQGKATILPRDPNKTIGQRGGFSTLDVLKVNRLYNCDGGSRPTTTTPAPTTQSPDTCLDNHRHCSYWSKREECTRNPAWMRANCRQSCNECNKPCEDLNRYCLNWARRGECTRNAEYMTIYCQKSCGTCPDTSDAITTPVPSTCEDKEKHCNYWANNGECSKNPNFMHKQCPKACKIC